MEPAKLSLPRSLFCPHNRVLAFNMSCLTNCNIFSLPTHPPAHLACRLTW